MSRKLIFFRVTLAVLFIMGTMSGVATAQQYNMVINGDLEAMQPFFWSEGQTGGTMTWAEDEFHIGLRSLKIEKDGTDDAASWICGNQAQYKWNHMGAMLYDIGGYVNIMDGATFSSTEGERIGLLWTFLDADDNDIVPPVFIAATTAGDWEELATQVVLGAVPETCTCEAIMETDATGTVWFDDFSLGSPDEWTAGFFGSDASTPVGWGHWSDGANGYSELEDVGEDAHSGTHVAVLREEDDGDDEMNFDGEPFAMLPDTDYIVGVWVKVINVNVADDAYATGAITDRITDQASLCFYFLSDYETGWGALGDNFIHLDQRTESTDGWVRYWDVVTSPAETVGGKLLARFHPDVQGEIWYDDFFIYQVNPGDELVVNGDLETMEPFFWFEGQTGGTMTWADDHYYVGLRSLKIEKNGTDDAASWISGNQAQYKWNHMGAMLYDIGGYVNIMDGATFSQTEGERIGLLWTFLDADDNDIVPPVFIAATMTGDWEEIATQVVLGAVPETCTCEAIMETDATGTVWFDDFTLNSPDEWTAGFFGSDASTPVGWGHWSDGENGYSEMEDVGDEAHSGTHVAVLREEDDGDDEMNFDGEPFAMNAGSIYEFSFWAKGTSMAPIGDNYFESAVMADRISDRASLCFYFLSDYETGWGALGDKFIHIDQRAADSDGWVHYRGVAEAPLETVGGKSLARIHPDFQGEVWYDDFSVRELTLVETAVPEREIEPGEVAIPTTPLLEQNYPNPFNSSTLIRFGLPAPGEVELTVFDILGRQVATLLNGMQTAGRHEVSFESDGTELVSGIYFYRLSTPQGNVVRKMVYLK